VSGRADEQRAVPLVEWAAELQHMSQTGLAYARDPYDIGRYRRLRELAAEMLALGSEATLTRVADAFDRELGHATPKLDVRGIVIEDGRVLLVRERSDRRWTLPGGFADPGQSPSENMAREFREESGYEVEVTRLLAVHDRARHVDRPHPFSIYKLSFECRIVGGSASPSDETDGVEWFPADAPPELSTGRITPAQLRRLVELASDPAAPTEFD
jgi:ADP-ribose pyrophosphatase YjhB (NUDIX family)